MKFITELFFYGYVGLLIVAGAWGVIGARRDQRMLLGLDLQLLSPVSAASVLSQYRFLRAIEFGFGSLSFVFRRQIFTDVVFNRLFLVTMSLGVAARIISLLADGRPHRVFYFFLVTEAIGAALIFVYSRSTLVPQ